jgi:hypothetical protein
MRRVPVKHLDKAPEPAAAGHAVFFSSLGAKLPGMLTALLLLALCLVFAGCGEDDDKKKNTTQAVAATPWALGVFVDAPVVGLRYESGPWKGTTNFNGEFKYYPGRDITFWLGSLFLGAARGRSAMAPFHLISGAQDERDPAATNLSAFLQALDLDGDPDNGITINAAIRAHLEGRTINFDQSVTDFYNDPDVAALFDTLNQATVFSDGADHTLATLHNARQHARIHYQLANPDCNAKFRYELRDYTNGIGDQALDDMRLRCVTGPADAKVNEYTPGQFTVTGDYLLGSQNDAVITVLWVGGVVALADTGNQSYAVAQPGEGSFTVTVNTKAGSATNLCVRMYHDGRKMMDIYPKWDQGAVTPDDPADCILTCSTNCAQETTWGLSCEPGAFIDEVASQTKIFHQDGINHNEETTGTVTFLKSGRVYLYTKIYNTANCNLYLNVQGVGACYGKPPQI